MDFESMKLIWDSQNDELLFAFDREAVNAEVKRRAQRVGQRTLLFDVSMVLGTLGGSIVLACNAIFDDEWHDMPLAATLLALFVYVVVGIVARKRDEGHIEPSVAGDLNRSILQLEYRIRRQRRFLWWYMLPFGLGIAVVLPVHLRGTPPWSWFVFLVVFAFMYRANQAEIRELEPRKAGLESLRDKLLAETAVD